MSKWSYQGQDFESSMIPEGAEGFVYEMQAVIDGKLFVEGQKEDKETESNYIHKGLAQRSFKRVWTLADDTEVADVSFEDGLLSINLKKIVPDHHKRKDYL